ncbi:GRIP and coiled-coil domain-containing protein 2 isoform X6 [Saccopteryx bilineata]|uniref:GRIP and coiled-coil domain-containing protein 2 isoform X6 n=1 Tax=Saccopteryx bilineata TaxID=59482 RepID=UPI003390147F
MEDPVQDGVAPPATPGTRKSKLETLPKEDLIKFAKNQMMLIQKANSRCTELEKEIEELKSKPVAGGTGDIIKALTVRLDALLLDKAETEQECLSLKKENIKMKQQVEDSVTNLEDMHKEFEQSQRNYMKQMENLKNELMAVHFKHSEDKARLQKELEEAKQLKFQSDSEDNVKKLQEEIQKIRPAFEEQISFLQKQLKAAKNEKEQEITHLQKVIEANSEHSQKYINNLQEELVQLKAAHQEEVKELMCHMAASAEEHEEGVKLNDLKENLVKPSEASENIQEKYECELGNLGKASNANQENQKCSLLLQEDTFVEQIVNEKVKHLEDTLKELESQHNILRDEVLYMNNLKLKLEIDAQHIKDEFFHEREELEFKINELLLAKEEQGYIIEKLKSELKDLNKQLCCTVEQHNKEVQSLQEQHQKEISDLHDTFLSDSEKEKLTLMFEIQYLKEQCENLQQEKQEAVLNYEHVQEIMVILQTELGESAGKISQEFESMKQQQASDVHELQQKLRTAFNEKDTLLEAVNHLRRENEKLLSQKELASELENVVKNLQEKNEEYLVSLSQRDSMLQEFEAKINYLTEEKNDFLSKIKSSHEEDSLEKSPVESDQSPSVKELEEKIEYLEKESKEKEEKINKIKLVAVKAKKELDSSRREAQTLREELKSVQSEKDRLSASMRDLLQGAESYKSLLLEYDKQSEQLDIEKGRAKTFEHHIEDLTRELKNSTFQCEKLNSDNDDLWARVETLQSNAKLLEVQILEVQKAKAMADKELEAEKLKKEQKIKEHASSVSELEELRVQLQKEKKQLQKTMQELELVKKDAQQTTLMNMEIADYERLMKELNQKLTNKNSKIEDLEQEKKIQKQKQETLKEEITSLQTSLQQYEEKNTKIKQLLMETKKELADSKQSETDHLMLQASLKSELEASQQLVEVYKIQLAEMTAEKHSVHERLKTSADQHQRTLSACQQRVAALQEECRAARVEQAAITSEFENYKVRVHNVLKQQKNKSVSQTETKEAKQEREHLEMLVDQLKIKLQDTQKNLQFSVSELQTLQSEHDTLLERHNRMLQETVSKEAELREKLCSIQSENMMMKSEHAQTVSHLSSQNEVLCNSFRDQVRHLQEEHRKTVESLQQQLSKVETQLFHPKSEPTTKVGPTPSHQLVKNLRERRNTDLPLLDMHGVTREEGEGMETSDAESVSSAGAHRQSLEQLLNSPEAKLEPSLWHAEFTKEELMQKLSSTTKSADHLNGLLRETEATNAILIEQIKLLKSEIRRLERNQEREKSVANLEYLKNVLLQFIFLKPGSERERLLPVIDTMLQLSPEEKGRLAAIAQGEEENASRSTGWASYLHSWSGLR